LLAVAARLPFAAFRLGVARVERVVRLVLFAVRTGMMVSLAR
jgi:hypothetical protein